MRTAEDQARRSKQNWERGRGARRISNPNYTPVTRNGRKVYVLRKNKGKKRTPSIKGIYNTLDIDKLISEFGKI